MTVDPIDDELPVPPEPGRWLARQLPIPEYVRPLHDGEHTIIEHGNLYFRDGLARPAVAALRAAYDNWRARFSMVEDWTLGPLPGSMISEPLVSFLLTWRMTVDQLASEVSERFGKDSPQWEALTTARHRAYDGSSAYRIVEFMRNRVQHDQMPPITRSRTRPPAGGRPRLAITVPGTWLLESPNCPRLLRTDLTRTTVRALDMNLIISESFQAFEDVLCILLLTENSRAPLYLETFQRMAEETAPAAPTIVLHWLDEDAHARAMFDPLTWLQWADGITRASRTEGCDWRSASD